LSESAFILFINIESLLKYSDETPSFNQGF